MKNRTVIFSIGLALLLCIPLALAEGVSLEDVKCIFAPKDAKETSSAEWKEGKVYFCCNNCKGKFEKMTKEEKEKVSTKSNAQLVATKQYEQKSCPLTGGDLNKEATTKVNGVSVAFCCNNCKGKVEKMEDEEKMEVVFSEKAFKTAGFTKVEVKK